MLQQAFVKQNIPKSSFQLVPDTYWTIDFFILSIYTLVATTLSTGVLFEGRLPGIL